MFNNADISLPTLFPTLFPCLYHNPALALHLHQVPETPWSRNLNLPAGLGQKQKGSSRTDDATTAHPTALATTPGLQEPFPGTAGGEQQTMAGGRHDEAVNPTIVVYPSFFSFRSDNAAAVDTTSSLNPLPWSELDTQDEGTSLGETLRLACSIRAATLVLKDSEAQKASIKQEQLAMVTAAKADQSLKLRAVIPFLASRLPDCKAMETSCIAAIVHEAAKAARGSDGQHSLVSATEAMEAPPGSAFVICSGGTAGLMKAAAPAARMAYPDLADAARDTSGMQLQLLPGGPYAAAAAVSGGDVDDDTACEVCGSRDDGATMVLCDRCDKGWHMRCLQPPLRGVPRGFWACPLCAAQGATEASCHPPHRGPSVKELSE